MAGRNFTGDGTDDILLRNVVTGELQIWTMSGGARIGILTPPNPLNLGVLWSAHVGVDETPSDDVADIFRMRAEAVPGFPGGNNGTATIMDGNQSVWWNANNSAVNLAWNFGAIGNMDGDAFSEFILRDPVGHFVYVDDLTARGGVQTYNPATNGVAYQFLFYAPTLTVRGTGDFNGDGKADLVFQDPAGTVFFADVDDGTFDGWGLVTGLGPDWRIDAIGDINNDGIADIIVRNTVSHDIFYGRVANGGGIAQWFDLGDLTAAYAVRGLADVTGDGVLDLLVQRSFGAFPDGKVWYADISTGSPVWTDLPNPFPWSADWVII